MRRISPAFSFVSAKHFEPGSLSDALHSASRNRVKVPLRRLYCCVGLCHYYFPLRFRRFSRPIVNCRYCSTYSASRQRGSAPVGHCNHLVGLLLRRSDDLERLLRGAWSGGFNLGTVLVVFDNVPRLRARSPRPHAAQLQYLPPAAKRRRREDIARSSRNLVEIHIVV